ncbi:MAG TPA: hypothetical protein VFP89_16100 [Propionibacteriaceae bacterium]|nr:hypothetical protein [Propionibacteriaceae bacterium]
MQLVPSQETAGMYGSPSRLVATAIIDDIEGLAAEYREAAADHRNKHDQRNTEAARVLEEAADTCHDIIEMIRREYITGATTDRPAPPLCSV